MLGRLVVGVLRLSVQPSLGGLKVRALDFAGHVPYGPDKSQRKANTCQKMGEDRVGDVQDLGDREVAQVAVVVLDAMRGPFASGC